MALEWDETAPGLLYEADGDSGRRYVIAFEHWTLDLFRHSEYEAVQQVEPQSARNRNLTEAKRMAQDWETELY